MKQYQTNVIGRNSRNMQIRKRIFNKHADIGTSLAIFSATFLLAFCLSSVLTPIDSTSATDSKRKEGSVRCIAG